jgi:DNA-directed RNA polymerase specialized sigma24 family protein
VVLLPELTRGNDPPADDVVQDALVSALKCQHQFTPGTNPKAWLFTIVRNKFLSAVSRKHVSLRRWQGSWKHEYSHL